MDRLGDLVVREVTSLVLPLLKELDNFTVTYEAMENGLVGVR